MNKGKIVQVMGPVVDVVFEDGNLPEIKDALEVENNGKRCVMEVSHHLGNNMVRCIMLSASEGLQRDREVIATGSGIKVPVGDKTLGRLFNVLGDTVDDGPSLEGEQKWVIHRDPPDFEHQKPAVEILETGIKVIDLLAPYAKGGKIGLFGGAGVGKTVLIQELIQNIATAVPFASASCQKSHAHHSCQQRRCDSFQFHSFFLRFPLKHLCDAPSIENKRVFHNVHFLYFLFFFNMESQINLF